MHPYLQSLVGGVIIGTAASILLLFNGRVAGISGIYSGLFRYKWQEWNWRMSFVFGLISGGAVLSWFHPEFFTNTTEFSYLKLSIAGFLVGHGTVIAKGCTSGHGVCGLSRLSKRSLVAVLIFMSTGMLTASLIHFWGVKF